jgi:hypothetical protein
MHQTVYIDVDEEITSILDRIRREQVIDIFLIVPKGAMLLNSIINLKLLKKETEKMGKAVSIVAPNDNRAKIMIERAGIKAEDYNLAMNERQLQQEMQKNINKQETDKIVSETVNEIQHHPNTSTTSSVGTTSFFSAGKPAKEFNSTVQSDDTGQSVQQIETDKVISKQLTQQDQAQEQKVANNFNNKAEANSIQQNNSFSEGVVDTNDSRYNYFNNHKEANTSMGQGGIVQKILKGKKFLLGGGFVLMSILGLIIWYFINYPKLELTVQPLNEKISEEVKVIADDSIQSVELDNGIIPGEYLEMSLEKTTEFKATGEKVVDKNGARARGVVTIFNYFSEKPQPLVKTTRVLSEGGKLFRLTKGIMVPGMKDGEPGKVDVTVQADKPGSDYNIDESKFTIEGFKGNPKYEKFKVSSSSKMTGGVTSDNASNKKMVSEVDLVNARKKVLKGLDDSLMEEIKKRLNPGQKIVESSVEKEIVSNKASHLAGTIADNFSYTIVYKIKIIAFDDDNLRNIIKGKIQKKLGKEFALADDFKAEATRAIVDLDKKKLTIYVDVSGVAWFKVDQKKIKENIIGLKIDEIKPLLNKKNGVKSAEIKSSPAWNTKAPKKTSKITIKIVK